MIRAYVFDLGGVLARFDEAPLYPLFRPDIDHAAWWRFVLHHPAFRGFELGTVTTEAMAEVAVRELCHTGVSPAEFLVALARWPTAVQPGAVAVLRRARARGVPVVLLSNTNPLHWGLLGVHFRQELDHAYVSYETGALKPEAEAFAVVERGLAVEPAGLCFFDDNPHNIAAAAARGWQAHRVNGPADIAVVLAAQGA